MVIEIDFQSDEALYTQLMNQIIMGIATSRLQEGDPLLVKRHLESWGYEVFQIEDFTHVIQEFVQKDPQLVLLDLKLPFFNGFHWCEEIRKISRRCCW